MVTCKHSPNFQKDTGQGSFVLVGDGPLGRVTRSVILSGLGVGRKDRPAVAQTHVNSYRIPCFVANRSSVHL